MRLLLSATRSIGFLAAVVVTVGLAPLYAQHAVRRPIDGRPAAIVDLRTAEGVRLVNGQWRYSDAAIVDAGFKAPGPDHKPSGSPIRTHDITPRAGAMNFDDSRWQVIAPEALEARRSTGKLAFNWYRTSITIPERVGAFPTAGSTVVFEIVVDDYAEVWVDGRLPRVLGQTGGALIKGFNAPNRVVLTTDAQPGQTIQLAIFGVNGPLADPPPNFIWVRSATLDFFTPGATTGTATPAQVTRRDASIDAIVPPGATIEKLADGFLFTEGPVWLPEGYLLFSDPNSNTIYRWSDTDGLSVFRAKSGYTGMDIGEYGQPGSNGLALDREGRLTINEHGNRRVTRLETNGSITVLADRFDGRTAQTISSTRPTDRSISAIHHSGCRSSSTIRGRKRPSAASTAGSMATCNCSRPMSQAQTASPSHLTRSSSTSGTGTRRRRR